MSTRPGGGLYLGYGFQTVANNTIVGNEAYYGPALDAGGAIAAVSAGSHVIERNILANTVHGGGIYCDYGVTLIIDNNLAWENTGGDGAGTCAGWELTDGNILADPFFCNPAMDDFTVAQQSPALTHPAGPLGAFPDPGCNPVAVEPTSWGRLKQLFR